MYSTRKLLAFLSSRVDGGVADEERHDLAGQLRGRGDGVPRRRTDLRATDADPRAQQLPEVLVPQSVERGRVALSSWPGVVLVAIVRVVDPIVILNDSE